MSSTETIQNEMQETSDSENQDGENPQQSEEAIEIPPCTDLGNAERLVGKHGHEIRYCPETKDWYFYQGDRWIADNGLHINGVAYQVSRDILEESRNERAFFQDQ